jgi:hypothetical protein
MKSIKNGIFSHEPTMNLQNLIHQGGIYFFFLVSTNKDHNAKEIIVKHENIGFE